MADETKRLLGVRKGLRKKTPPFRRTDLFRHTKLLNNERWNKPKGRDNKIRRRKRGAQVQVGYGGPRAVRHMHPRGLWEVLVHTVDELQAVDPKTDAARIAATVGNRKKTEIVKAAETLKIKVLNPAIFKKVKKKNEPKKTEKQEMTAKPEPKKEEKSK